jgi:hypothetical protein
MLVEHSVVVVGIPPVELDSLVVEWQYLMVAELLVQVKLPQLVEKVACSCSSGEYSCLKAE